MRAVPSLALLLATVGCGTGGGATAIPYVNPPGCAEPESAVPAERLDAPPRPVGLMVIPRPEGVTGEFEIRMVVGADGHVDPASVRVSGIEAEEPPAWASAMAEGLRFEPARAGGCFVPASFRYRVTFGQGARGGGVR